MRIPSAVTTTLFLVGLGFGLPAVVSAEGGQTLASSIPAPAGYTRVTTGPGSYGRFLQTLPVKKDKRILAFNGNLINDFNVFAVADLPLLFHQDLEQCADFAMRLWAEYHQRAHDLNHLYLFDYNGKRKAFKSSGKSYLDFLKASFANANSYSLKRGCAPVPSAAALVPGDMLVQNQDGGIGHVSVILDVAEAEGKPRLYLIGFSFMPAQEFHIEKAQGDKGREGWFTLEGYQRFLMELLPFGPPVLRRFAP
jgi:hypothetical protein